MAETSQRIIDSEIEKRAVTLIPFCKPLRVIELMAMVICFIFLFFLRSYTPDQIVLVPPNELIWLFVNFASLFFLLLVDVFSQVIREPTSNVPMILVTLMGSISCCVSGIALVVTMHIHLTCPSKRIRNTIGLLAVGSFFSAIVFVLDLILLIRFR